MTFLKKDHVFVVLEINIFQEMLISLSVGYWLFFFIKFISRLAFC